MLCHRIPRCLKDGPRLDGRAKNKTLRMDCRKLESRDAHEEFTTKADAPCYLSLLCGVDSHFSAHKCRPMDVLLQGHTCACSADLHVCRSLVEGGCGHDEDRRGLKTAAIKYIAYCSFECSESDHLALQAESNPITWAI